jgi:hypothetical protein
VEPLLVLEEGDAVKGNRDAVARCHDFSVPYRLQGPR